VVKFATPADRFAVPTIVWPSRKVTIPVALEGLTAAVSVTAWLCVEVAVESVSAVLLLSLEMIRTTGLEVLGALLVFPS